MKIQRPRSEIDRVLLAHSALMHKMRELEDARAAERTQFNEREARQDELNEQLLKWVNAFAQEKADLARALAEAKDHSAGLDGDRKALERDKATLTQRLAEAADHVVCLERELEDVRDLVDAYAEDES